MMKIGLGASIVAIAAMIAISVYGWIHIPADAMLARHWNASGIADEFSPRDHVLIGGPLLAAALSAFFALIPLVEPRRENVKSSAGLLLAGWVGVLALLSLAYGSVVFAAANGVDDGFTSDVRFYGLCLLLIVLGNFMAKSRSNYFLGVRTPWTHSSEHAWSLANRTGGWLFVAVGLASAAAGMAYGSAHGYRVLIAGAVAAALVSIIVSYLAWLADPERKSG